jgi:hypothetical protein
MNEKEMQIFAQTLFACGHESGKAGAELTLDCYAAVYQHYLTHLKRPENQKRLDDWDKPEHGPEVLKVVRATIQKATTLAEGGPVTPEHFGAAAAETEGGANCSWCPNGAETI